MVLKMFKVEASEVWYVCEKLNKKGREREGSREKERARERGKGKEVGREREKEIREGENR